MYAFYFIYIHSNSTGAPRHYFLGMHFTFYWCFENYTVSFCLICAGLAPANAAQIFLWIRPWMYQWKFDSDSGNKRKVMVSLKSWMLIPNIMEHLARKWPDISLSKQCAKPTHIFPVQVSKNSLVSPATFEPKVAEFGHKTFFPKCNSLNVTKHKSQIFLWTKC